MPVEVCRDAARRPASAVLLDLRGRPAPEEEGLEVVEVLRAVVVRVPQFETRELIAGVRCPEDRRPHLVARVDAHLHARRLEVAHQIADCEGSRSSCSGPASRSPHLDLSPHLSSTSPARSPDNSLSDSPGLAARPHRHTESGTHRQVHLL